MRVREFSFRSKIGWRPRIFSISKRPGAPCGAKNYCASLFDDFSCWQAISSSWFMQVIISGDNHRRPSSELCFHKIFIVVRKRKWQCFRLESAEFSVQMIGRMKPNYSFIPNGWPHLLAVVLNGNDPNKVLRWTLNVSLFLYEWDHCEEILNKLPQGRVKYLNTGQQCGQSVVFGDPLTKYLKIHMTMSSLSAEKLIMG